MRVSERFAHMNRSARRPYIENSQYFSFHAY
jgi:hypothetical protein